MSLKLLDVALCLPVYSGFIRVLLPDVAENKVQQALIRLLHQGSLKAGSKPVPNF